MKLVKRILIIFLIAIVFISCEKEVYRDYYSNGTLKEEYSMKEGRFVGRYRAFYDDGKPRAIGEYKKGEMTGNWQYFYPNGKIQSVQIFKIGKPVYIDFWDIDGVQLVKEGTGIAKLYHPSGFISSVMSYRDNQFDGKCETWFPNGIKASESFYENGKPVGTWKYWDEYGELIKTEEY